MSQPNSTFFADDPEYDSPYVQAARAAGNDLDWFEKVMSMRVKDGKLALGALTGGKLDDITVVVARVTSTPRPAAASEAAVAEDSAAVTADEETPVTTDVAAPTPAEEPAQEPKETNQAVAEPTTDSKSTTEKA